MKILCLIVAAIFTLTAHAEDWSKVYKKSQGSIPIILHRGGICSGALIAPDQILTAHHCVKQLRPIQVTWSGNMETFETANVIQFDKENDLAILRIPNRAKENIFKVVDSKNAPEIGQPIATIGHPVLAGSKNKDEMKNKSLDFDTSDTFLISAGIVSGKTDDLLVTDTSFSPGNSGGPVLNLSGDIVGVVSRKRVEGFVGDIGYATSSVEVEKLVTEQKTKGDRKLAYTDAFGDFFMGLGLTQFSVSEKTGGLPVTPEDKRYRVGFTNFRLGYAIFDRIPMGFNLSLGGGADTFGYFLGYKFIFGWSAKWSFAVAPIVQYNRVDFRLDGGPRFEKSLTMPGIMIGAGGLTLTLSSSTDRDLPISFFTMELGSF